LSRIINLNKKKVREFFKQLLIVLVPLLLGSIIYIFCREPNFNLVNWFGLNEILKDLNVRANLPNWVIYNLPDGLWVFAFTYLVLFIFGFKFRKGFIFLTLFSPIIISLISEIGQLYDFMQGTFDLLDVLFYLIGFLLPVLLNFKKIRIIK
jgi:hypothetical protein